jgi:DNA-binding NarL/FixJ family response regulator
LERLILHIDDHRVLLRGIKNYVTSQIKDISYLCFGHPNDALSFVKRSLATRLTIDLIITDFNHLGCNGYEFATRIRSIEQQYGKRHLILLLTMMGCDAPLIIRGCEEGVFDKCIGKDVEEKALLEMFCNYLI